jgi:hypothetical protein
VVIAGIGNRTAIHPCCYARPVAVAAVENLVLINDDGLMLTVGLDVGDELGELLALKQRKDVR